MICTKEYRLNFQEQAQKIIHEMTLDEKIEMMSGHSMLLSSFGGGNYNFVPYDFAGCPRLGVEKLAFCDGPRGVVSGQSTCFPVTMARGATFNRELEHEVGKVIGREVLGNGGNYFGGVCMNVPYNPGAGRSQECYGEDGYLMGEMAVSLMEGVQEENVMACAKHYAFNSMERSRFKVSVDADKRTEREVYLPHFKKVVDAGCVSIMSAYSLYKGEKCGHNAYLLRDVLKKEWDFDGFVISDFMLGVTNTVGGVTGGCDVEMHVQNKYKPQKIKKALRQGKITEEMLNEACLRIVRSSLAFQEARKHGKKYGKEVLGCGEHVALARKVAEEAITLVKNNSNILPLSPKGRYVLAGDMAAMENIGDHGSSKVRPKYVKTLCQAMTDEYADTDFTYIATKDIDKKISNIKGADAVVIVCGMKHNDEGEFMYFFGGDRESLSLHKADIDMINTITAVNKNVVVVLMGGNVVMAHDWKDKVKGILYAYYPGMEGGSALADILFGRVNPSGHLPFAVAEDEKQYPRVNWNTKQQDYGYYHGYAKIDKEGGNYDFPYGYGLSYTQFEYSNARFVEADAEKAIFSVNVKNTGDRDGADVVQLYIGFPDSCVDRPVRILAGFEKEMISAREEKTIYIEVKKSDLGWYDEREAEFKYDTTYIAYIAQDERCKNAKGIEFSFGE